VDVLEASQDLGAWRAIFDFGGISIERFYHFVCRADAPTVTLLRELGIADKLRWKPTSMGFFSDGRLNRWGDPLALLRIPGISLITKLRYGLFVLVCSRKNTWPQLEARSAKEWITAWCGKDGYKRFWETLLQYKFYEYADSISAAWIWTRIKRVGSSRKSIMQEELGYLEGGSKTLIDELVAAIEANGGRIHLGSSAQQIVIANDSVVGVQTKTAYFVADHVISTIPMPNIPRLVPDLPAEWRARYEALKTIGICCVVFKLKRSVSPHFWINLDRRSMKFPASSSSPISAMLGS